MEDSIKYILEKLGAEQYFKSDFGIHYSNANLENLLGLKIPKWLKAILKTYAGSIKFAEGARLKPNIKSGREDADGYLVVDILYGSVDGNGFGLIEQNKTYLLHDFFPKSLTVIGESAFGDQICLHKKTKEVIYWKHDVGDDPSISTSIIAKDFEEFLKKLEPDNADFDDKTFEELGVIVDELNLDI